MTPLDLSTHLRALGFVHITKFRKGRSHARHNTIDFKTASAALGIHRDTLRKYLQGTSEIKPVIQIVINSLYARRKQRSKT